MVKLTVSAINNLKTMGEGHAVRYFIRTTVVISHTFCMKNENELTPRGAWQQSRDAIMPVGHSHPGCINRLRKHYSHLVGVHFWQRKASWVLSRHLPIENAGHCMLVNEWVRLNSQVCLSCLKVHLGSVWNQSADRNVMMCQTIIMYYICHWMF